MIRRRLISSNVPLLSACAGTSCYIPQQQIFWNGVVPQRRLCTDSTASGGTAGIGGTSPGSNSAVTRTGFWLRFAGFSAAISVGAVAIAMVTWPLVDAFFLPYSYKKIFLDSGSCTIPPPVLPSSVESVEEFSELLVGFQPSRKSDAKKQPREQSKSEGEGEQETASSVVSSQPEHGVYGSSQGQVILVTGAPGSGKSSLAGAVWKNFEQSTLAESDETPHPEDEAALPTISKRIKAGEHRDTIPPVLYINCRAYSDPATILYGTMVHVLAQLGTTGRFIIAYEKMFNAVVDFFTMGQQHAHVSHIFFAQSIGHIRHALSELEAERKPGQPKAVVILDGVEQLVQLSAEHPRNSECSVCARNLVEMFIRSALDDHWCNTVLLMDSKALDGGVRGVGQKSTTVQSEAAGGTNDNSENKYSSLYSGGKIQSLVGSTQLGKEFPEILERAHLRYLPFRPSSSHSELTSPPTALPATSAPTPPTSPPPPSYLSKGPSFDLSVVRALLSEEGISPVIMNAALRELSYSGQVKYSDLCFQLGCYPSDALDTLRQLDAVGLTFPVVGTQLGSNSLAAKARKERADIVSRLEKAKETLKIAKKRWFGGGSEAMVAEKSITFLESLLFKTDYEPKVPAEIVTLHRPVLTYVGPQLKWSSHDEAQTTVDVHLELSSSQGAKLFRSLPLSALKSPSDLHHYMWRRGYPWWRPMLATDHHLGPDGPPSSTVSSRKSSGGGGVILDRPDVISCVKNGDILRDYSPFGFKLLYYVLFPLYAGWARLAHGPLEQ